MLTIEKKNSPLNWLLVAVTAAITATLTTFIILIGLNLWTQSLCGNVSIADYANHRAPAKCQALWYEGNL